MENLKARFLKALSDQTVTVVRPKTVKDWSEARGFNNTVTSQVLNGNVSMERKKSNVRDVYNEIVKEIDNYEEK